MRHRFARLAIGPRRLPPLPFIPLGDRGCLSLFTPGRGEDHRLVADHLTAEYRVRTEGRGRTVDEWKLRATGMDNHWLDCLVGNAVAASTLGVLLPGTDARPAPKPRIRLSALQARRA